MSAVSTHRPDIPFTEAFQKMIYNRPIFWQQGTFLEPQHFQLLEYQRRADLSFILEALHPWPWGFSTLKLNEDALASFTLEVMEMDLWLPGGFRLTVPGNAQVPASSFRKAWANPDELLDVYLAARDFSPEAANVELPQPERPEAAGPASRKLYSPAPPESVPDLLGGGPSAQVDTLLYNACLLFGAEAQGAKGMTVLPIARLARQGEKVRRTPFAPASLRLYADSPLREFASDVLELLKAKGRELEEYKMTPAQSRLESLASNSLALVSAMGIVLRHTARLHCLLASPAAHPYAAFSAIRELAAELTVFAPGISALGEPLTGEGGAPVPYDHKDPLPSFKETISLVARLLDTMTPGPDIHAVFQRDGRNFTVTLPPLPEGGCIFWVAARTDLPSEEAKASVSGFAKLASPDRARNLISYNLPGVTLTPLREAPVGLPRRPDTVYFAVRQKDPLWEEAIRAGKLLLFWDDAPAKAELTLVGSRL
ncbi:MAG: type VI secretion system baseplate subunit TssK [Deltaproteobacteria bacterium]|jgi:type VI secretion system protein ImpJ|nr:type VI secretion system baseplate subunit TssK [Deltaproteobacteria bacterium]